MTAKFFFCFDRLLQMWTVQSHVLVLCIFNVTQALVSVHIIIMHWAHEVNT